MAYSLRFRAYPPLLLLLSIEEILKELFFFLEIFFLTTLCIELVILSLSDLILNFTV